MGFWIFMLVMDLLIPFTMIGFGKSVCISDDSSGWFDYTDRDCAKGKF